MFQSARIKLTAWYLLIIMLISITFSFFIYFSSTRDFDRILRVQRYRIQNPQSQFPWFASPDFFNTFRPIDPEIIEEAKLRIIIRLMGVNLIIFSLSGLAGYFLAGRTLEPIKEMMDEQNRFITDASHELRTPLTALRAEMEVNLRDKNLSLKGAKAMIASNLEEVSKLQLLSDHLLELAQFQKAPENNVFTKVSLNAVLGTALKAVTPLAKKKRISIKTNIIDSAMAGNEQQLEELFVILLDNAIKYSKAAGQITLTSKHTDHGIIINLKDEGLGIDQKDLPYIFDRFYRADESRSKSTISGYGLGLSIAKQIVEAHKGTITVESKVGNGTTFIIRFPQKRLL